MLNSKQVKDKGSASNKSPKENPSTRKETAKAAEYGPPVQDGKTEEEYLKDIEDCEKKIMRTRVMQLNSVYNQYMEILQGVQNAIGEGVVERLGFYPEQITELYSGLQHIENASPADRAKAKDMLSRSISLVEFVLDKAYDKIEAEYVTASDPALGLTYEDEVRNLRASKKSKQIEFKGYDGECTAQGCKIRDLNYAVSRVKDQKWYKSLEDNSDAGPSTETVPVSTTPSHPTKGYSKDDRTKVCQKIIAESRKKIIKHLLEQFNEIHAEFKLTTEMSWDLSRGEMSKLLVGHRDMTLSVARHDRYNKMPKDIPDDKLAEVIEDMTHGVKELILDYEDLFQVSEQYQQRCVRTGRMDGMPRAKGEQMIQMMKACKLAKDADFKRFDARIRSEQATIDRFNKEIQTEWDTKRQAEMLEDAKTARAKLIEEMIKLEQKKCEAINCNCIEKEPVLNMILPGSGTRWRYVADRKKVEEILNGAEPWKEERQHMEEFTEKMFRQQREDLEELEEAMAGVDMD